MSSWSYILYIQFWHNIITGLLSWLCYIFIYKLNANMEFWVMRSNNLVIGVSLTHVFTDSEHTLCFIAIQEIWYWRGTIGAYRNAYKLHIHFISKTYINVVQERIEGFNNLFTFIVSVSNILSFVITGKDELQHIHLQHDFLKDHVIKYEHFFIIRLCRSVV